jgi:hypothetical protein
MNHAASFFIVGHARLSSAPPPAAKKAHSALLIAVGLSALIVANGYTTVFI